MSYLISITEMNIRTALEEGFLAFFGYRSNMALQDGAFCRRKSHYNFICTFRRLLS